MTQKGISTSIRGNEIGTVEELAVSRRVEGWLRMGERGEGIRKAERGMPSQEVIMLDQLETVVWSVGGFCDIPPERREASKFFKIHFLDSFSKFCPRSY